jgi:hypothetical protein
MQAIQAQALALGGCYELALVVSSVRWILIGRSDPMSVKIKVYSDYV